MLFPTPLFTCFLVIFLALWWGWGVRGSLRRRWVVLTLGSFVFYSAAFVMGPLILLVMGTLTYCAEQDLNRWYRTFRRGRGWFWVGVLLTPLLLTKYTAPWLMQWNEWAVEWGWPLWKVPDWVYPVGLSFITFHALTRVIQVWHERVEPAPWWAVMAQVSAFPALLAGPVSKATQWISDPTLSFQKAPWFEGLMRMGMGMTFKWVFATQAEKWVQHWKMQEQPGILETWWALVAYGLQLFFDFAGYSLMALAVAGWLGYRLPENFLSPYASSSLQEFWRNWHRSLSHFFRDHLYIDALGGSRRGKYMGWLALTVTMVISGVWHGVGWMFIIWGFWHAGGLILDRLWSESKWSDVGRQAFMWVWVFWGWVWFQSTDMQEAQRWWVHGWSGEWGVLPDGNALIWMSLMLGVVALEKEYAPRLWAWAAQRDGDWSVLSRPIQIQWTCQMVLLTAVWAWWLMVLGPVGVPPFIYAGF